MSRDTDAVLAACRLLVAVSVQSLAVVDDQVSLPELRALVVLSSRDRLNLSELATATGLHLSKTSRMCDRLAARGLISRADNPVDRRSLHLSITDAGQQVVQTVQDSRRETLAPLVRRLPAERRALLTELLLELTSDSEIADTDLWALGWVT